MVLGAAVLFVAHWGYDCKWLRPGMVPRSCRCGPLALRQGPFRVWVLTRVALAHKVPFMPRITVPAFDEVFTCEECGTEWKRPNSTRGSKPRFCSRECQLKSLNRQPNRTYAARSSR